MYSSNQWNLNQRAGRLLQAMLFSAFAHAGDDELHSSPFSSILEAQRALFPVVQSSYDNATDVDPGDVSLVQIALLLSHWNPCDGSKEVIRTGLIKLSITRR